MVRRENMDGGAPPAADFQAPGSWFGDAEIPANLAGKQFVNLVVTGDGAASAVLRIAPPRVLRPLANERAAVSTQVGEKSAALHAASCSRTSS